MRSKDVEIFFCTVGYATLAVHDSLRFNPQHAQIKAYRDFFKKYIVHDSMS
jgi:hypothetical protein